MKRLLLIAVAAVALVGCEVDSDAGSMHVTVIESFEKSIDADGGYSLGYSSDYLMFENGYDEQYGSWNGFAVSKCNDMTSGDWSNQYSVYNEKVYSGSQFLLFYYDDYSPVKDILCRYAGEYAFDSVYVNLSTYTALAIKNGNGFARAFEDGDYLKVKFTALLENKIEGESVEFFLADYRDGKSYLAEEWAKVDLSPLKGALWGIRITMETTDVNEWGACTPLYVCLDHLIYSVDF
ncbi:MAG: DUF4465 domain-containing protein [Alistipes sp.]|nr:DUF4465 domain-containing protein [Alistipes sp.]